MSPHYLHLCDLLFHRRHTDRREMCTKGHWRPAEDAKLTELVAKYGPHNWNAIAEMLQGRSGAVYISVPLRLVSLSLSLYGSF